MEKIIEYSPIIVVILMFFIQQKIFVTPEQLEKKHREIIDEIEEKYVSMNSFIDLKEQFSEVKDTKLVKLNVNYCYKKLIFF